MIHLARSRRAPDLTPDAVVARARLAGLALFAGNGVLLASWLARVPSTRAFFGLDAGTWGLALAVGAIGQFAVYPPMGAFIARWGTRRVLLASTWLMAIGLALISISILVRQPILFAVGMVFFGMCWGTSGVPANMEAARVERRLGRTLLPQFHGTYSVGAVAGAALGSLLSALAVPVPIQLAATGVAFCAMRLWAISHLLPAEPVPAVDPSAAPAAPPTAARAVRRRASLSSLRAGSLGAWFEKRTLLIGAIFIAAFVAEGAANDWLATSLVEGFGRAESVGAIAYALFLLAMTAMRLTGARLIDRFGRVTVLRASNLVALAGLAGYLIAPSLPFALAGIVAWGLGAALVGPIAIAAATEDPVRAASRVAVISTMSSGIGFVLPTALGSLSALITTRYALGAVGIVLIISLAVAGNAAPDRKRAVRKPLPALFSSRRLAWGVAERTQRAAAKASLAMKHPNTPPGPTVREVPATMPMSLR